MVSSTAKAMKGHAIATQDEYRSWLRDTTQLFNCLDHVGPGISTPDI